MFLCRRGRPAGGGVPAPGLADPQTGYRSAQDSPAPRPPRRRLVRFAEQTAEQLVEVPTLKCYSSLRRIVEQKRGHSSSSWSWRSVSEVFKVSQDRVARYFPAATAEQIVDTLVPRGDRTLHPSSSSSGLPGTANQGVFRTFPRGKKCDFGLALGVGTAPRVEPIHARGSAGGFLHGCSRRVDAVPLMVGGNFWARTQKSAAGVKAGTFLSFVLAQFALGIWYIFSSLLLADIVPGVWVLLMCTKSGFFGR